MVMCMLLDVITIVCTSSLLQFISLGSGKVFQEGQVKQPVGICIDSIDTACSGLLVIMCQCSVGKEISSGVLTRIKEGELVFPCGMAVNNTGNLLVCDC